MTSLPLYSSQLDWDKFNQSMANIFSLEYKQTPYFQDSIKTVRIKDPKHSFRMMGENNPNYGIPKSDITKSKISESNKGLKRSEETKARCKIAAKQRWIDNPTRIRKPLSDDQKRLISERTKAALATKKQNNS